MSSIPNDCWETILRDDSFMDFTSTTASKSDVGNNAANLFTDNGDVDFNSTNDFLNIYNINNVPEALIRDGGGYQGVDIAPEHSIATNGYGSISPSDEGINPELIEAHGSCSNFDFDQSNAHHNYGMHNWNSFPLPTWPLASAHSFQTESKSRELERPNSLGTLPAQGVHWAHSRLTSSTQGALDAGADSSRHHAKPIDGVDQSRRLNLGSLAGKANRSLHICPWYNCSRTLDSKDITNEHVVDHLTALCRDWPGPIECQWSRCKSKAVFHTYSLLKDHINNKHLKPLVCQVPGCDQREPFERHADLRRHERSKHEDVVEYRCNVKDCGAEFRRKDKLVLHTRSVHQDLQCINHHCRAIVFGKDAVNHDLQSHEELECAIGSCANGSKSRFSVSTLFDHLRDDHSISRSDADKLGRLAFRAEDRTARPEMCQRMNITWEDCKWCAEDQDRLSQDDNDA